MISNQKDFFKQDYIPGIGKPYIHFPSKIIPRNNVRGAEIFRVKGLKQGNGKMEGFLGNNAGNPVRFQYNSQTEIHSEKLAPDGTISKLGEKLKSTSPSRHIIAGLKSMIHRALCF